MTDQTDRRRSGNDQNDLDEVVIRLDATGMIIEVDAGVESLTGRSPADMIGRSARLWIHPDDLGVADTLVIAVIESDEASVPVRVRIGSEAHGWSPVACRLGRRSGRAPLEILIRPSRAYPDGIAGPPITAVPEIEMNPIADLLSGTGLDGFLMATATEPVFLSPGLARAFGMAPNRFFSAFGDVLHPDDSDRMVDLLTNLLSGTERFAQTTLRALRADGTWGSFRIRTRDLSHDPDFGVFITVIHQVTDDAATDPSDEVDPRLRHALSLAADPILVIADDGRVRFASSSTTSLIGRTVAEITTRPIVDLLTTESAAEFRAWWAAPTSAACRLRFTDQAGPSRWISARTVERGQTGSDSAEGSFRVLALRDIDDQVRAESALQRREARFAALLHNASGGVVILDEHGTVTAPGHALEQVLGLRSDLVIGLRLVEWVDPDDRRRLSETLEIARLRPGPAGTTVRQRVADGTWRWIHWTAQDHRHNPDIRGLVVNLDDRTEEVRARLDLEENERRLRAIVDHSFEVTVIADDDFVILWASPSLAELLGWDATEAAGRPILDFVHPDDVDRVLVRYQRALTDDGPEPSTPIRISTAAGTWRHVMVVAADRRDDPDVHGIILNLRDAEAQVAAERALTESETRYRMLVENATDVVAILDPDTTIRWISPTVRSILGIEPEELVGEPMGAIDDPTGREHLVEIFESVLVGGPGTSTRTIAPLRHADGTWRFVDLVLTNHVDEPGIGGVVAAYRDVTSRIEADRSLHASEERFRSLAESSPLGIFQLDHDQRCVYVNDRWCEITGRTTAESLGDQWRQPLGIDPTERISAGSESTTFDQGIPIDRPDGEARWGSLHIAPLTDRRGERSGWVGMIDDITATVEARRETRRLSSILESSPDLVLVFRPDGEIVYLNEAARRFFLIGPGESVNRLSARDLFDPEDLQVWTSSIGPTLARRQAWQGEVTITNDVGRSIPISAVVNMHRDVSGHAEVVSVTARDMTERAELEARLEHQATHDPLTDLPNRSLLLDRLGMALARARRTKGRLAVLFADLDRFKVVNDGLGHATGDELLKLVARRLEATVRPEDTVARLGGDEFVIVCEDLESASEAQVVAERISAAISEPAAMSGSDLVASVSIGITVVSNLDEDPDQVIRDADAAMYLAKQHGRARWEIFDPELRSRAANRLGLENALRRALRNGEFTLAYQPIVDALTGTLMGAEALLRWDHPERGMLAPAEFLDVAEESGLIVPIGDWVLATACDQMRPLIDHDPTFKMSINLSARQIEDPGLIRRIDTLIGASHISPTQVILEITESILMGDVVASGTSLADLRRLGVGLAIDDFGTGYSSLAYLQRYPVDVLKIDRSFVSGLGRSHGDEAIAEAIIGLAAALDLRTVAEGVETETQLAVLRRLGCDHIQGYLKSPPLTLREFSGYVAHQRR